ncbi:MAG: Gmad2 immunoglobulin-like domain-containing protein [Acidimicrobiales bacterium]
MSFDDDIRRTLHTEAGRYDPADDGWDGITSGVRSARNRRRRIQGGALGAVAIAVLAVGIGLSMTDEATDVDAGPFSTEPSTTESTETTTPTTTESRRDEVFPGIWPFASQEAIDRYEDGDARFEDLGATADAFARDYLGMIDPVVALPGEVDGDVIAEVRPKGEDGQPVPDGGPLTQVRLRSYETSDGSRIWTVVAAWSPNIVLDEPGPSAEVASPVVVRGEATGYEGTVIAQVRQDGMRAGESLGEDFGIAGTYGELAPFQLELPFTDPTEPTGAVVVHTDTGLDAVGVPEATVVRIAFEASFREGGGAEEDVEDGGPCSPVGLEGEPGFGEMDVTIYLTCDSAFADDPSTDAAFVPAFRRVPRTVGVLQATLEQLVAGPSDEERAVGQSSLFSAETADILAGVTIREGTAIVDLRETVDNASTSAGQLAFRGALNRTVFQFSTVERIEYRLDGSCDAFWQWQQVGDCQIVTRDDL